MVRLDASKTGFRERKQIGDERRLGPRAQQHRSEAESAGHVLPGRDHRVRRARGHHYRDGEYVLRDHNSRNGTFVNWERILQKTLEPGDVIEFGRGGPSAQFVLDTEAAMTPTLDLADRGMPDALRKLTTSHTKGPDSTTTGALRRFPSTRDFVSLVQRNKRRALVNTIGLVALLAVAFWQVRQRSGLQDSLAEFALTLDAERGTRSVLERNLTDIQVRYDSLL